MKKLKYRLALKNTKKEDMKYLILQMVGFVDIIQVLKIYILSIVMDDETKKLYIEAINKWGKDSQIEMALEEMGELITAINQYKRNRIELKDVCTEIADVQIMMEQLAIIFDENIVKLEKNNKLLRLQKRVNNGRTKI